MNKTTQPGRLPVSQRFYALMLTAYPAEFRRQYGAPMVQLFRDCEDAARNRKGLGALMHFWMTALLDLVITAPKEHLDNLRKEKSVMKNLRRDALALFGCVAIIFVAFLLLRYILAHQGSSTLLGYTL